MDSRRSRILFDEAGAAIRPDKIRTEVREFPYRDASKRAIRDSVNLGANGTLFLECTARVLANFGMTRSGRFKGVRITKGGTVRHKEILVDCWETVKSDLLDIRRTIPKTGRARDRYLLERSEAELADLTTRIWSMTKRLLPLTMSQNSYGLVGASKILFAVLPEIVLPTDNSQWVGVFKTVDLGDVISMMASDIRRWESETKAMLNELGLPYGLTTLPSVYNVMAMAAKPGKASSRM